MSPPAKLGQDSCIFIKKSTRPGLAGIATSMHAIDTLNRLNTFVRHIKTQNIIQIDEVVVDLRHFCHRALHKSIITMCFSPLTMLVSQAEKPPSTRYEESDDKSVADP